LYHIALPRQGPQGHRCRPSYPGERITSKAEEYARQGWKTYRAVAAERGAPLNHQLKFGSFKLVYPKITVETLEFSPLERKIYSSVYHNARHKFQSLDAKGQVGKNWQSIFALLMRYPLPHD